MIASVQIMSSTGSYGSAVPTADSGNDSSNSTSFQNIIGSYHSTADFDSNENTSNEKSVSTGVRRPAPAVQQPATTAQAQAKGQYQTSTSTGDAQETDSADAPGNSQVAHIEALPRRSRKLRIAEAANSAVTEAPAAPKNTDGGTAAVPFMPVHMAEPARAILPFTASITWRQSGDASQNSPAVSSESAAAAQATTPIPLSQTQAEEGTAQGSLAFAARLTPDVENVSLKAPATQPTPQTETKYTTNRTGRPHTDNVFQASTEPVAKQLHASHNGGSSSGDASDTFGGESSPQTPRDLLAGIQAPFVAPSTQGQTQRSSEIPATSSPATQSLPTSAHLEKVESPTPPLGANHEITIRVSDLGDQNTSVRFLERGGEVHVSVRTTDVQMAQTLRGDLNDLVNRLQAGGIQTEVWQPGSDAFTSQNDQHNNPFTNPDGSNGNSSGSNSERESGQQQKPRWLEELEKSIDTTKETPQLWQA